MISPSMRKNGGAPAVMCLSLAPFSTIALGSWWRLILTSAPCVIWLVPHRDAEDFLCRRHAVEHLENAAHAQRQHACFDRRGLELGRRRALEDHLLQVVGEAHDLVERDASLVARAVAGAAPEALHEPVLPHLDLIRREPDVLEGARFHADLLP